MGWARTAGSRQVLGPDVDIVIKPIDETNTRVRADRIVRDFKRGGGKGLICLVGVQSNQFPHAVDLARKFLEAGLPVAMGGFHAAGCLSMLPVVPPEIQEAMDMGISIYAGEAEEGRLDEVLRDAWNGTLKPLYNYMDDLPGIENAPTPHLPAVGAGAQRGQEVELRSRPRLPVPVLVLHHHQRAGPQEPLPQRRRSRGDHPRELQAGHHVVLHHRRQHGAQPPLGRVLRPHHRAQGERGHRGLPADPGRHPVPSHPALHRQGAVGRRLSRASSGWRTSTPTTCWPPRSGRTRSPNTARCCRPGTRPASRPGRATSSASPATRANRSCATWRSSRRSCRSTSSSCSC